MKTLRQIVSEVAQPKAEDEKAFKAKHIAIKTDHPVAPDHVFTGKILKAPKRRADYDKGEDEIVYEGSFDVPTAEGGEYDSEDSHVSYKKGNKSPKAMKEAKKMDPVGREDDDIDNDGDVDSSDKYLHARRRAISKAIKKEATDTQMGTITVTSDEERKKRAQMYRDKKASMKKEKVEEAYSDAHRAKMAKSYKGKNPHHINAMSSDKGTMTIVTNNGNKYTVTAKETGGKMPKTGDHINKWKPGTVKEEVELEEAKSWFMQSDHDDFAKMTPEERKDRHQRLLKLTKHSDSHIRSFAKAAANEFKSKYMKEEVESLDEFGWGDDLVFRGMYTTDPSGIPDYSRKTEKGKKSLAKQNLPKLKDAIKRQLGRHPKPRLPEEVEQVDEVLKSTTPMGTWIKDFQKSKAPQFKGKSQEKRRQMAIAAKYGAEREAGMREEVEFDENYMSKENLESVAKLHDKEAKKHANLTKEHDRRGEGVASRSHESAYNTHMDAAAAHREASQGKGNHTKESLDKVSNRAFDRSDSARKHSDDAMDRRPVKEEVEQLDELSPNTLHSYIKGASKDLAKRSRMSGYDDKRGNYADGDKNRKLANKRMAGITSASGRLADKANMAEDAWEEVPMMMRQLEFICYAAEEIMDYLDMGIDPEEWYQNKLANAYQTMMSLYSYARGEMRMSANMYGEETELDESDDARIQRSLSAHKVKQDAKVKAGIPLRRPGEGLAAYVTRKAKAQAKMKKEETEIDEELIGGQKKLDHNKNGKIDAQDFHIMRKKKIAEETELDESITKMSHSRLKFHLNTNTPHGSYSNDEMKAERDRRLKTGEGEAYRKAKAGLSEVTQSAVKKTVTYTDAKGHSRTRNVPIKRVDRDEYGQDKIRESIELDEVFNQGILKLKDGASVILKKEDADLLNQMFKDLSTTNRSKMQEIAMKDKNGFNEILSFAREAL